MQWAWLRDMNDENIVPVIALAFVNIFIVSIIIHIETTIISIRL